MTPSERIMARVVIDEASGCWLWQGATNGHGYGQINVEGRMLMIHRVVYESIVGPIPAGLVIDHVRERGCLHRNCVNAAHLEPVTNRENILRGDTVAAQNLAKTHCPKGHLLDYDRPGGGRGCRACRSDAVRRYKERRTHATV